MRNRPDPVPAGESAPPTIRLAAVGGRPATVGSQQNGDGKNKAIIIHVAWLAAIVAAFAVGHFTGRESGSAEHGEEKNADTGERIPVRFTQADESESGLAGGENGLLTSRQFAAALCDSLEETNPVKRAMLFSNLLQGLSAENAKEGFAALREGVPGRELFQEMVLYAYAWGATDGPSALRWMENQTGFLRMAGVNSAVAGWASTDPDGAIDWVKEVEDDDERQAFVSSLISGVAKSNPDLATDLVFSMADEENADLYLRIVTREKLKAGIDEAISWASSIPLKSMKNIALESVAGQIARKAPETAMTWVKGLDESPQKDNSMAAAMAEWSRMDPEAASEYLVEMQPSTTRDAAIGSFSKTMAIDDPEAAMAWAMEIGDDIVRAETLTNSGQRWFRRSPEAAEAWLSTSKLTAELQDSIRNPPTRESPGARGAGGRAGGGFGRFPGRAAGP